MSLFELDGYLTAIVIGPDLIMPSEWLPTIWGGHGKSKSGNISEVQTVLNAVMDRYNEIIRQLDTSPQLYRPLYLPSDQSERPSTELAEEWAHGFWKGMMLRPNEWGQLIRHEKARAILAPIMCFIRDDEDEHLLRVSPEELDDLLIDAGSLIPEVIPLIQEFWRSKPPKNDAAPKVRRNDPCPCGSGRKYKRCCGAN